MLPAASSSPRRTWRISSSSCCVSTAKTIVLAASRAPGARSCMGSAPRQERPNAINTMAAVAATFRRCTDALRRHTETWIG